MKFHSFLFLCLITTFASSAKKDRQKDKKRQGKTRVVPKLRRCGTAVKIWDIVLLLLLFLVMFQQKEKKTAGNEEEQVPFFF